MNYNRIIDIIKDEVSKERQVVEDLAYKDGYQKGLSEKEDDADFDDYSSGYFEGIEDAWEAAKIVYKMSPTERGNVFNSSGAFLEILEDVHPIDVLKNIIKVELEDKEIEYDEIEYDEDLARLAVIYGIESSDMSDSLKNSLINYIKENKIKVVVKD